MRNFILGICVGIGLLLTMAAYYNDETKVIGIGYPANGGAIVADSQGNLFVIDGVTGHATRVLYSEYSNAKDYPSSMTGKQLSITQNAGVTKSQPEPQVRQR
jgi:hypothetical protein